MLEKSGLLVFGSCVVVGCEALYRFLAHFEVGYSFVKTRQDAVSFFRWRDYTCKLLFAGVVSIWSLLCIHRNWEFLVDLEYARSDSSILLIAFVAAYYFHHILKFASWFGLLHPGFLIHHLLVVIGGPVVLVINKYHGIAVLVFMNVIPDIFLEVKCLLYMNKRVETKLYKRVKYMLIITTLLIRFPVDILLLLYIAANLHKEHPIIIIQGLASFIFIIPYHMYVFVSLVKSRR